MTALALAIDPGRVTGAALWGFDGYLWSKQGDLDEVAHALAVHRALPRVGLVCCEAVFASPERISGSLSVAESAGRILGALLFTPIPRLVLQHPWRPTAKAWRKEQGWASFTTKEAKQAALTYAGALVERSWFSSASRSHEAEAIAMAEVAYHRMIEATC
jgi:hypothetical protein